MKKKKSKPTWQDITEGRLPLSKRTQKALETTRAIRERSPNLRATLATVNTEGKSYVIPMDREDMWKLTPDDITLMKLELNKLKSLPLQFQNHERIQRIEAIFEDLKQEKLWRAVEAKALAKANPRTMAQKINAIMSQPGINGKPTTPYRLAQRLNGTADDTAKKRVGRFLKGETHTPPARPEEIIKALNKLYYKQFELEDIMSD